MWFVRFNLVLNTLPHERRDKIRTPQGPRHTASQGHLSHRHCSLLQGHRIRTMKEVIWTPQGRWGHCCHSGVWSYGRVVNQRWCGQWVGHTVGWSIKGGVVSGLVLLPGGQSKVVWSMGWSYSRVVNQRWCGQWVGLTAGWSIKSGFEFEWGFYALSASKAIFRARTYNCNLFSPVMMITR